MKTWNDILRENFHVLLLTALVFGMLTFTLHMAHHDMDKEMVSWGRETCGAVIGALLLALRGRDPNVKPPETLK